jgi:hypothetical protein
MAASRNGYALSMVGLSSLARNSGKAGPPPGSALPSDVRFGDIVTLDVHSYTSHNACKLTMS